MIIRLRGVETFQRGESFLRVCVVGIQGECFLKLSFRVVHSSGAAIEKCEVFVQKRAVSALAAQFDGLLHLADSFRPVLGFGGL